MTKDILIKFLTNSCTEVELNEVARWVDSQAFNDESKMWGFEDWGSFQVDENMDDSEILNSLLDKIHRQINIEKSKYSNEANKTWSLPFVAKWLTRAAAIILFPVLSILFYTLSENNLLSSKIMGLSVDSLEVESPIGSRTVVQLSDGSEVHLNYGSKLKYPHIFSGKTREVILTGEAYFNVAHNPENPFIVKTKILTIKALGTVFNVSSYPDDDNVETTLVEGKVVLEQTKKDGEIKSIGTLVPGQHVNYNPQTGSIISTKGNIQKFIAWKDGKLVFENESIVLITDKLSRMFNVDIEVLDNIKYFSYTVTFVDEPLYQILDLMTIATPVKYKMLPREKLPDGTFSKQKIIIEKKTNN